VGKQQLGKLWLHRKSSRKVIHFSHYEDQLSTVNGMSIYLEKRRLRQEITKVWIEQNRTDRKG